MVNDLKYKMSKILSKKDKKREELNKRKRKNESSDSESNSGSDSDSTYNTDDVSNDEEMDVHEYRKFLKELYPSKHLDKKIKNGEKLKKKYEELMDEVSDDYESDDESEEEVKKSPKKKQKTNKKKQEKDKKKSKKYNDDLEEEDEESWSTESDDESEEDKKKSKKQKTNKKKQEKDKKKSKKNKDSSSDEDISLGSQDTEESDIDSDNEGSEEDDDEQSSKKENKINMVFTIGFDEEDDGSWEDDEEYEDESLDTEDEDEPVSESESEYESDTSSSSESEKKKKSKKSQNQKSSKKDNKKNKESSCAIEEDALKIVGKKIELPEKSDEDVLKQLKEMLEKEPNNKSIKKCIKIYQKTVDKKTAKKKRYDEKVKAKHGRIFKRIMRDKNSMNDFNYFDTLETTHQKKLIKELREINKTMRVEKPYRISLLESDIPTQFKGTAIKKINSLKYMDPGSGEYYKIKNWVDTFMRIPFGKYETLPINMDDGVDKCHNFMENAQKTLDEAVYGLNDAKMQIMQMLGQLITNPKSIGCAIAIQGPMGTGKTTLVKEGISKILNRPFAFLALGGATDSSFLEGHSYTYEGSTWGKIVQILIDSKCMNPVIYFDELDKISDTPKGEEIAGILTHLTDTSQNSQFHDKYFAEVDFDLSKCLFIFSYNDESRVNPILRDRMYRIQTKGYDRKQKTMISNNYLLPRIREQVKFTQDQIIIPEETIHYIIENHCNKEDGVRNLKRCMEIIYTKLNLYRLMRPDTNLFEQDMSLKVEFPFTVTKQIVDKLIKKDDRDNFVRRSLEAMYV